MTFSLPQNSAICQSSDIKYLAEEETMTKFYRIFFMTVLLATSACWKKVNIEKESTTVKSVIDQFYQLHVTENMELLSQIMAHDEDMVNFGTDAVEHWIGWESVKEAFQKQWDSFENPEILLREQAIKISRSGNVAWYSMLLDFKVESEGKEILWNDVRTTGVLEKRDGRWIVVQFHNSLPALERAVEYEIGSRP